MLKEHNVRVGFFEREDYLALLKTLPVELRPVVTFAYHTGWRKQEILGLTWDRVDLNEGTVRLEASDTKNSRARMIYLEPDLLKLLKIQYMKRKNDCPYVFHRNGKRIKDFRGSWARACENLDIGDRLFHDLRRTGVRNMIRAGIQESVAMRISGHRTRAVFDRYNIIDEKDLQLAAQKMAKYNEMVTKTVTMQDSSQPDASPTPA